MAEMHIPRYGGALEWVKALQGRWHSGSGLLHMVHGFEVTCEQTGSTTTLELPTKNIVMLMGVAIKVSSTHTSIEWTDGDIWTKVEEEPLGTSGSATGGSIHRKGLTPARPKRSSPSASPAKQQSPYYGAQVEYSPVGNHPLPTHPNGTTLDTDRYTVRQQCRDWEYDYSPLRNQRAR
eukprot:TRINITY_DN16910_c0_g1_i1.p1 TRINITY_DN16910_c0_g1~~TRINITY_DN16910_c0_g1_i1.p1  ORF type:complete len:178 (+),score=30.82 TRINITY_DN16910_c0_g1_i1:34-567(+)